MRRLVILCTTAVVVSCVQSSETLRLTRPSEVVTPTATITIHGLVTDVSGRPLAGAQVELAGPGDTWGDRGEVRTNNEGAYTFRTLLSGAYEQYRFAMRAKLEGYADKVVETRVVDGVEVNFKLSPTE